jgi:hypothetical protein
MRQASRQGRSSVAEAARLDPVLNARFNPAEIPFLKKIGCGAESLRGAFGSESDLAAKLRSLFNTRFF